MSTRRRLLIIADRITQVDFKDIPHDGLDVECRPEMSREEFLRVIGGFDAYMCSLAIRVDAEVIAAAPRLRVVASNSTGTDHLDLERLARAGVTVYNNKHDRAMLDQVTSTAELAFGLLLTCARHLPLCFEASRQGRWERHALAGQQISGKTLGIIGLGRLGTMMMQYGRAFRMRILACDPRAVDFPEGVEGVDLDALLAQADFVSLHVHLTPETQNMLDAPRLARMKRGACLINTSRGGLIDEQALIAEMKSGRIAAAGLDVIDGEWLADKFNHPLIAYSRENPRLYITPHVGGTSLDAVRFTIRHTFKKVVAFFEAETRG